MPYIGNTIRAADDYRLIDDISSGFNGSTTSFALQVAGSAPVPFPKSPQQVLISVNGVIQEPDPTGASGFNLVGTNIVFSSAPTNGHAFFGIIYATADYLNAGGNFPAGALGSPSITFIGDENTGLYRKGSGSVGFVSDATEIANFDSNGITISSGNLIIPDSIIHGGDPNTKIRFSGADTVSVETAGTQRLEVASDGKVNFGSVARVEADGVFKAAHGDASTPSYNFLNDNDNGMFRATTNELGFSTGGTERLRIDNNGNVGIGTNNPGQLLDVVAASGDANIRVRTLGTGSGDDAVIRALIGGTTGSNYILFGDSDDSNAGQVRYNHASNYLSFDVNASEALRIDSSGNVGIGTTSPSDKLHISNTTSDKGILIKTTGNTYHTICGDANRTSSGDNILRIDSKWNGTVVNRIRMLAGADTTNKDDGIICFDTASGGSMGERMRIDSSGNVMIGTQTAGEATADNFTIATSGHTGMTIRSGTTAESNIFFADGTTGNAQYRGMVRYFHNADALAFNTSAVERLRIDSNGNVGIGTTSPAVNLDVSASSGTAQIYVRNTATSGEAALGVQGKNSSGTTRTMLVKYDNNDSFRFATAQAVPLSFSTSDVIRLTVNSDGNVGIGTGAINVAPTAKLHIIEGTSTPAQIIKSGTSTNQNVHIKLLNDNEAGELVFGVFGSSASTFGNITAGDGVVSSNQEICLNSQNASGVIKFGVGSTPNEKMRIDSSGRVGIGTTSPSAGLHISTTVQGLDVTTSNAVVSEFKGSGGAGGYLAFQMGDNGANIGYLGDSGQLVSTGGTNDFLALRADNGIEFAIGTAREVRVDSDGIKFGSDTAAANALDDYEEGTFTPHVYG